MLFRNRRMVRAVACLLLFETLTSILEPSLSWAMSGPGQPEFTSYESPGSTDMVNLTTGDLTYNLPLLDIPGPERSLSLPLTYRAGIRLEQEASWVGLGWSLNPGAIARSLNGYPDDASSVQRNDIKFHKDFNRGWYGGIPGVVDLGWDSETGRSGSVDVIGLASTSWASGRFKSADLVGVKYTKGEGLSVDPVRMAFAAATIASAGTASSYSVAANLAIQAGQQVGVGVVMAGFRGVSGVGGGFNQPIVHQDQHLFHTDYWVYQEDDTQEFLYGSLYFRDLSQNTVAPTINAGGIDNAGPLVYKDALNGASYKPNLFDNRVYVPNYSYPTAAFRGKRVASDLHLPVTQDEGSYYDVSMRPLSIAHDGFSVMGGSATGSIRPQLLEVGSVAIPRRSTQVHLSYNTVSYLNDYKVPFRYENSLSNGYAYHRYSPPGSTNDGTGVEYDPGAGQQAVVLKDPRLMALNDASTRTAPARKGIRNAPVAGSADRTRGLDQGNYVQWYTMDELRQGAAGIVKAFAYGEPLPDRFLEAPDKNIGAFAVTAADGTTYHYSLPVQHRGTFAYTREVNNAAAPNTGSPNNPGVGSSFMHGTSNASPVYASSWLLTAITSSDYVDRGELGVVDERDWGGWVKLSYGRFGECYNWRQPYTGEAYQENDEHSAQYTVGARESYYLNAIHTRTHTALFVKSVRNDARGHFGKDPQTPLTTYHPNNGPASSLRLDEIVLLTHDDWGRLQTPDGIRQPNDNGAAIPALANNTASTTWDAAELRNDDTYAFVLDAHDVDTDPRIRAFLTDRALKRVRFNYSYDLCQGTPNSFPSAVTPPPMDEAHSNQGRTGKLTLESVAIYGPHNTKLVPDYRFTYGGPNPNYVKHAWDGFGMYNSQALNDVHTAQHAVATSHYTASQDGAAWSLTEILDPMGGRTRIRYERDQYAMVSEYGTTKLQFTNPDCSAFLIGPSAAGNLEDLIKPKDHLVFNGAAVFTTTCQEPDVDPYGNPITVTTNPVCYDRYDGREVVVKAVTPTTIELEPGDAPVACDPSTNSGCDAPVPNGMTVEAWLPRNRNGGDLRVASVTTLDENGNAYQVRYQYTKANRAPGANSTGVLAKEPGYVVREPHVFDNWYDYPSTPVLYGLVTVKRGSFKTDDDYDVREEYAFHTPTSNMIGRNADFNSNGGRNAQSYGSGQLLERTNNQWTVDLGLIGQPASVRRYNRRGEQEFESTFAYSTQVPNADGLTDQGHFTEGIMTNEFLDNLAYRVNRSTKEYIPRVLASTTTRANGMETVSTNDLYDLFSGQVVQSHAQNSLGQVFVTQTVPAYTQYAGMGPRSASSTNSNMLTQTAATYVFKRGAGGVLFPLSAQVQTWKSAWSYTTYDVDNSYQQTAAPGPVWRMSETYAWTGAQLNADGTYAGFVDFNWLNPFQAGQHPAWQRTAAVTLYNPYSLPLESLDLNEQYSASHTDEMQTRAVAAASNARYTEMVYSGAEDAGIIYARNYILPSTAYAHTGQYSNAVAPGNPADPEGYDGFRYVLPIGSAVRTNRAYRLSVWVRAAANNTPAGLNGAKLLASVGNRLVAEASVKAVSPKKAGDWYLLDASFNLAAADAGQTLKIACKNGSGAMVYFDDFRFQPLLSTMPAYVYDAHTGKLTHSLNNDNLFTRYEHDNTGKLVRVYQETFDRPGNVTPAGGRKVEEYAYNYARSRSYTVQAGSTGAGQVTSSLPGGLVNQVNSGDVVTYSAVPNACQWYFASVTVDGVTLTSTPTTLPGGTVATRLSTGCRLSNIQANHNVTIVFGQHPAAGTEIHSECFYCASLGEYTGLEYYDVADGCGGSERYSRNSTACLALNNGEKTSTSSIKECPASPPTGSTNKQAARPSAMPAKQRR